jgi:hypothetical protein
MFLTLTNYVRCGLRLSLSLSLVDLRIFRLHHCCSADQLQPKKAVKDYPAGIHAITTAV